MSENEQVLIGEPGDTVAQGGRRCALERTDSPDWDWYIGVSPRNGLGALCEGSWADWVRLAQNILAVEAGRLRGTE